MKKRNEIPTHGDLIVKAVEKKSVKIQSDEKNWCKFAFKKWREIGYIFVNK